MGLSPDWVQAICAVIATLLLVMEKLRRRQAVIKKTF